MPERQAAQGNDRIAERFARRIACRHHRVEEIQRTRQILRPPIQPGAEHQGGRDVNLALGRRGLFGKSGLEKTHGAITTCRARLGEQCPQGSDAQDRGRGSGAREALDGLAHCKQAFSLRTTRREALWPRAWVLRSGHRTAIRLRGTHAAETGRRCESSSDHRQQRRVEAGDLVGRRIPTKGKRRGQERCE
ncbi:MAG TPA: hypothetical protein VMW75_24165 [Thermoanaerobaculia bacterium]|nr:hypothetical protein [Thermoanaerobaculia bacterium]